MRAEDSCLEYFRWESCSPLAKKAKVLSPVASKTRKRANIQVFLCVGVFPVQIQNCSFCAFFFLFLFCLTKSIWVEKGGRHPCLEMIELPQHHITICSWKIRRLTMFPLGGMRNGDHVTLLGLFKVPGEMTLPTWIFSSILEEMQIRVAFFSMLWWNSRCPRRKENVLTNLHVLSCGCFFQWFCGGLFLLETVYLCHYKFLWSL
jgi:hypothetical protein